MPDNQFGLSPDVCIAMFGLDTLYIQDGFNGGDTKSQRNIFLRIERDDRPVRSVRFGPDQAREIAAALIEKAELVEYMENDYNEDFMAP